MSRSQCLILATLCVLIPGRAPAADFLGKSQEAWIRDLKNDNPETRRSAAFALGKIGALADPNLAMLASVLRMDKDAGVRAAAATAIGEIISAQSKSPHRSQWMTVQAALKAALRDDSAKVKRGAAYAIGSFGPDAEDLIPDLITALSDKTPFVRQNVAWALGRLGKSAKPEVVDLLINRLQDDDPLVRRDAASALGDIGDSRAWKPLLDLVSTESAKRDQADDVLLRTALAKMIIVMDSQNKRILTALKRLDNSSNDEAVQKRLRDAVGGVLKNLGAIGLPESRAALDAAMNNFAAAIQTGQLEPILDALSRLEELGKRANSNLGSKFDSLLELLRNEDPETRMLAAFALARIGGPLSKEAVPVLRQVLKDPDAKLQEQAATFLGEMGPLAIEAAAALVEALQPPYKDKVRSQAAVALTQMGPQVERVTPELLKVLDNKNCDATVRMFIGEVFTQMGYPNNRPAMPVLLDVIENDPSPDVRHSCIWVFLNMKPEDFPEIRSRNGASAEKVLTGVLTDPKLANSSVTRYDAARALAANLREKAPPKAADVLLEMMADDRIKVYEGTDGTATNVGSEGTTGATSQTKRLKGDARYQGAEALGLMGKGVANRPDVIKALKLAQMDTKDETGRLRKAATEALKRILD